jgi:hypothetical protein
MARTTGASVMKAISLRLGERSNRRSAEKYRAARAWDLHSNQEKQVNKTHSMKKNALLQGYKHPESSILKEI